MGYSELVPQTLRLRTAIVGLAVGITAGLSLLASPAIANTMIATTSGPPLATPEIVAATPSAILRGIGSDAGEGVWFFDEEFGEPYGTAYLAHYTPSQSGLTRIAVKSLSNFNEYIQGIAPGPNGTEWFARFYDNEISHITASGKLVTKKLPPQTEPQDVVVDQQGVAWFTSRGHGCELGRLPPKGKPTFYTVGGDCYDLTIGPNGNIWIADYTANRVVEMSAATGAMLASYSERLPAGIATLGQDIYVTEAEPAVVLKIAPSGTVTEYALPPGHTVQWMVAGPDGAVWFNEPLWPGGESAIGRLTPNGEWSEVPVPGGGGVDDITATGDAIYFTQGGPTGHDGGVMRIPLSNFVPPEPTYVALGDSYSSGEGNPPFEPGTDDPNVPDLCHRSYSAYAPLLDQTLNLGAMTFKACSGAATNDIFDASETNPTEPAQLDSLTSRTQIVTLTIGGNDAGFPWVLEHCVEAPVIRPNFGCAANKRLANETKDRLVALGGGSYATSPPPLYQPIHSLLSVIQAIHAGADSAQIYIGLYPLLFGKSIANYAFNTEAPSGSACEVGNFAGLGLWVDYNDAQWLNKLGKELNTDILDAVKAAKATGTAVTVVPPSEFVGHGFCDEHTRWFHPLEVENNFSARPASFHPTEVGQHLGYETAFAAKVK